MQKDHWKDSQFKYISFNGNNINLYAYVKLLQTITTNRYAESIKIKIVLGGTCQCELAGNP